MHVLTVDDYATSSGKFKDRIDWLSPAIERNAKELLRRVNALLVQFGESRAISSGLRTVDANRELKNASPYSRHMTGEAVDLEDPKGSLKRWLNAPLLAKFDLYAEDFAETPTWLHLQTTKTKSGKRIFLLR
jgi:hypothetical protein